MKTLILVRHAKSSWENLGLTDFDRPLNDRGKQNAPEMAKRLNKKKIDIDAFISSPAKRARRTAEYFAKEYKLGKKEVILEDELYHADEEAFSRVIARTNRKYDTIAVFSHNPGITDYANSLTDQRVDNMPTCAIFAVKAEVDDWQDFPAAPKTFWFFDYPKSVKA